jgi:hypothetical protein
MIELAGLRYGVDGRTAKATTCLVVTAGVSYSSFIARFALPWFGVRSREVLRLTESGWATFALVSILIAAAVVCSLTSATRERITNSFDAEEAPGHWQRWRLFCGVCAWLDVKPVSMGLAICIAIQVLQWSSGSIFFDVLVFAIAISMVSHVSTLWRLAQHMRADAAMMASGESEQCRMVDRGRFDAFDEQRFAHSRWKPPHMVADLAEAEQYSRRARSSRRGWIATTAAASSFLGLVVLVTLGETLHAIAHDLAPLADLPQPSDSSFLQSSSILTGSVVFLALTAACQARANEMADLTALYKRFGDTLPPPAPN